MCDELFFLVVPRNLLFQDIQNIQVGLAKYVPMFALSYPSLSAPLIDLLYYRVLGCHNRRTRKSESFQQY